MFGSEQTWLSAARRILLSWVGSGFDPGPAPEINQAKNHEYQA
jgi:hypothetical protein